MEAILRLALNKFKAGGKSATPAQAVQLLMDVNILPTLGPAGETVRMVGRHVQLHALLTVACRRG